MKITIIAALSEDRVLSRLGKIPWYVPGDMKFFKRITLGYPIIMGRKTADTLKGPLVGRRNIVLSKHRYDRCGFETMNNMEDALDLCIGSSKVFIIGGGEIYEKAMDYADFIILSIIPKFCQEEEGKFYKESDLIKFPEIKDNVWDNYDSEEHEAFKVLYYKKDKRKRLSRWK